MSATAGPSIGRSSTSIGRRPRRRRTSMQERDDETSEPALEAIRIAERGQVPPGRMKPSWTASRASSWSRRISLAAASSRATNAPASTAKASRSPRCARSTSSRWSTATLRDGAAIMSRSECRSPWSGKGFPGGGGGGGGWAVAYLHLASDPWDNEPPGPCARLAWRFARVRSHRLRAGSPPPTPVGRPAWPLAWARLADVDPELWAAMPGARPAARQDRADRERELRSPR